MALAQAQRALAALVTSEAAREQLRDDEAAFAREFSLTRDETRQLRSFGGRRLYAYVDSLDRKRANEAVRLLPHSSRACGPALRRAFLRYARCVPSAAGPGRSVRDALAFAKLARADGAEPAALRELLDFEATSLRAATTPLFAAVRRYGYPVARVARAIAAGEDWACIAPRPTRVAWVAVAGRTVTRTL